MKPQCSCLAMCATPRVFGLWGTPGFWWRPEDAVRLVRLLARPALVAVVIVIVTVALLLGGRSLAPYLIGGGLGSPGHMSTMSAERVSAERHLQAETARLLATFEASNPAAAPVDRERP